MSDTDNPHSTLIQNALKYHYVFVGNQLRSLHVKSQLLFWVKVYFRFVGRDPSELQLDGYNISARKILNICLLVVTFSLVQSPLTWIKSNFVPICINNAKKLKTVLNVRGSPWNRSPCGRHLSRGIEGEHCGKTCRVISMHHIWYIQNLTHDFLLVTCLINI